MQALMIFKFPPGAILSLDFCTCFIQLVLREVGEMNLLTTEC